MESLAGFLSLIPFAPWGGSLFFKKSHDDIDDKSEQEAEKDAGRKRKMEGKVFPFYMDITWQVAQPGNFFREKKKESRQKDKCTDYKKNKTYIFHICSGSTKKYHFDSLSIAKKLISQKN